MNTETIENELQQHYRQEQKEKLMVKRGIARKLNQNNKLKEKGSYHLSPEGKHIIKHLFTSDELSIFDHLLNIREGFKAKGAIKSGATATIGKWLQGLGDEDIEKLCYIACQQAVANCWNPVSYQNMAHRIGKAIASEINYSVLLSDKKAGQYMLSCLAKLKQEGNYQSWQIQRIINHTGEKFSESSYRDFTHGQQVQIGTVFVELFTGTDLFTLYKQKQKKGYLNMVVGSDELLRFLEKKEELAGMLKPVDMPMLVKPRDWVGVDDGGYLTDASDYAMINQSTMRNAQVLPTEIKEGMEALNALQRTGWRVNKKVLRVAEHIIENTDGWDILADPVQLEVPAMTPMIRENQDMLEEFYAQQQAARDFNNENRANRIRDISTLQMAREYEKESQFFYPHFFDWRTRMYPKSAYLSPQGADVAKGLLEFSEGKKLGKEGSWHLAVHIANCFGFDKEDLAERVRWVIRHTDKIKEIVEDPINNRDWWITADKPFQFLQACFDWCGYLQDGDDYISHLACAADGSQNGVQNWSAIMKCEEGGLLVNLLPQQKPNDLYRRVAEAVAEAVEELKETASTLPIKDVETSNPYPSEKEILQDWLDSDFIQRKLVKQPVMTFTYSVTGNGIREQLQKTIKPQLRKKNLAWRDKGFWHCYVLSRIILEVLGTEAVASTVEGMEFVQDLTKVVVAAGYKMKWSTPTGFPVEQWYTKKHFKEVRTNLYGKFKCLQIGFDTNEVKKGKQVSAVAANFIHSIDASHAQKTVVGCVEERIEDFCMIHDSFGTHASNMGKLNSVLRDKFILIHSKNLLEKLLEETKEWLPEEYHSELPQVPQMGKLDITQVKQSKHFFC